MGDLGVAGSTAGSTAGTTAGTAVREGGGAVPRRAARIASAMAPADGKRSPGAFASARSTTARSAAGTASSAATDHGVGGCSTTRNAIDIVDVPGNGAAPVSTS